MKRFSLDPADVTMSAVGQSSGRRKARFSRANQSSSYTITLKHQPTGIEVQGSVAAGNYSRQEMRTRQEVLHQQLYAALEDEVAKALRISGR
jgi:hypothetical protein